MVAFTVEAVKKIAALSVLVVKLKPVVRTLDLNWLDNACVFAMIVPQLNDG